MERQERTVFSAFVAGKAVHAAFDGGRLTSDAGVLLLGEIERRPGIAERLARIIHEGRRSAGGTSLSALAAATASLAAPKAGE